jgi:O-antigen ligase
MQQWLETITLWALLLLPLAILPALGLLTPYAALLFIIPLFFVTLFRRQFFAAYASYTARAFLFVFVVQAVLFTVTADSVSDALKAFNFTMILAYGAIAWFLQRHTAPDAVRRVTLLAGIGVLLGFAQVAVFATMSSRPSAINVGPIVLSNGLMALGFLALGGALVRRSKWDWLYFLAPLLAVVATLLTQSRGPLIALPFAALAAAIFFWRYRFAGSLRAALIGLAGLIVLGGAGAYFVLHGKRSGSIVNIVDTIMAGGAVADESTRQRLVLYRAGWHAFEQSPWIGHGWGNIMSSALPYLPWRDRWLIHLPQLHNDVLNFAVASGVVGIVLYLIILTAPLIGALLSPRDALRPFRLYATTTMTIVYAGGGLTDLMFGFEFHTFLFAMLAAIVLGYCREAPAATLAAA